MILFSKRTIYSEFQTMYLKRERTQICNIYIEWSFFTLHIITVEKRVKKKFFYL